MVGSTQILKFWSRFYAIKVIFWCLFYCLSSISVAPAGQRNLFIRIDYFFGILHGLRYGGWNLREEADLGRKVKCVEQNVKKEDDKTVIF